MKTPRKKHAGARYLAVLAQQEPDLHQLPEHKQWQDVHGDEQDDAQNNLPPRDHGPMLCDGPALRDAQTARGQQRKGLTS